MDEVWHTWSRRRLLQAGVLAAGAAVAPSAVHALTGTSVALVLGEGSSAPEILWAADEFEASARSRGAKVARCTSLSQASSDSLCVLVAGPSHPDVKAILQRASVTLPARDEALGLVHGQLQGRTVIVATGHDVRGTLYALLELADRAAFSTDGSFHTGPNVVESPANKVRSLTRLFVSDVEDKPWYNDREMWPQYFSMLARQRFNRFNLAFGIGYDFIRQVTDAYFVFTYPFLFSVPGYNVRASNLPDAERDSNLVMLKYIAKQAVAHGLQFHVGLWMHGYIWEDSPNANHVIEGITPQNHGPYCRDAVRKLLQEVPEISGLTFRVHGESGVTEGSYDFWKMVFEGVATCGRTVAIDMHTKGMDETMQNVALATKLPIQMSPKYWGEHLGLPYFQSDIRVMEQPKADADKATGLMKLSAGTRSFLRYGYGDLLTEDRPWTVVHRIWPGTQRLLLWGDPESAAAYSRGFSFCGTNGVEIMEMLSYKGRRGSGIAGNRTAYLDTSLAPRWDWQKYEYTNCVWGRMLYNPDTDPEVFRRVLRKDFGPATADAQASLAHASRVLPTVLTAYAPSAGNNTYWPELYFNESYVDAAHPGPYTDSPKPVLFHTASTFDPPQFSRMVECAEELLGGPKSGRNSPLDVARWLEEHAATAEKSWLAADAKATKKNSPAYRRFATDVNLQILLGRFYAERFRSGVLYAIYEQTQDARPLQKSLELYRSSRQTWARLSDLAKPVYMADITVGEQRYQRGHWADRLPSMDKDIALVEARLASAKPGDSPAVAAAVQAVMASAPQTVAALRHRAPAVFHAGAPLAVSVSATDVTTIQLHYRHVDQAERYTVAPMEKSHDGFHASIPAAYTGTEYPLQYFFQVTKSDGSVSLYPGLGDRHLQQPYYVVRRSRSATA